MLSSIFNIFKKDDVGPIEVSAPYNFKHLEHVQVDNRTSTGFSVS